MVTVSESVNSPSLIVNSKLSDPLKSGFGTYVASVPSIVTLPFKASDNKLKVRGFSSMSLPLNVIETL